jgi:glutathionylspermidine synthase
VRRLTCTPRADWRARVEALGFGFHTIAGAPYWDESACYAFSAGEIDVLEDASADLHGLCLDAVDHAIRAGRLGQLGIPGDFHALVAASWERGDPSLYGRFDLAWDGSGAPKLLEYNADTPTSLLEAAVVQWHWLQETAPDSDQFNSLHERLVERWRAIAQPGELVHTACCTGSAEDLGTTTYLRDTAAQAGVDTVALDIAALGWDARASTFVDLDLQPVHRLFKLYPWEWLCQEAFAAHLLRDGLALIEPPWKMALSSKAILPLLWELNPGHPNLLRAAHAPWGDTHVEKPLWSREGSNVRVIERGRVRESHDGPYRGATVFQEWHPLPEFSGNHPVLGSWIVGDAACGLGIREDVDPITGNGSRFVPHRFATE